MKKIVAMAGVCFLLLNALPVFSANHYGLWTSAGVRKDFHKWKLELNQEFRFEKGEPAPGRYFTELSAGYDMLRWLNLSLGYRFIQDRNKANEWRTLHRFVADIEAGREVKRMEFSYRLRFTDEDDFLAGGDDSGFFLRQRLKSEYHFNNSPWDPYFSAELYYRLPDEKSGKFNKLRYTLGTRFSLNKKSRLGFFLRLQHEINVSKPDREAITGLSYTYRL